MEEEEESIRAKEDEEHQENNHVNTVGQTTHELTEIMAVHILKTDGLITLNQKRTCAKTCN